MQLCRRGVMNAFDSLARSSSLAFHDIKMII